MDFSRYVIIFSDTVNPRSRVKYKSLISRNDWYATTAHNRLKQIMLRRKGEPKLSEVLEASASTAMFPLTQRVPVAIKLSRFLDSCLLFEDL